MRLRPASVPSEPFSAFCKNWLPIGSKRADAKVLNYIDQDVFDRNASRRHMAVGQLWPPNPGCLFQMKVRVSYRTQSIRMPMISEDLMPAVALLQRICIIRSLDLESVTIRFSDYRILLRKRKIQGVTGAQRHGAVCSCEGQDVRFVGTIMAASVSENCSGDTRQSALDWRNIRRDGFPFGVPRQGPRLVQQGGSNPATRITPGTESGSSPNACSSHARTNSAPVIPRYFRAAESSMRSPSLWLIEGIAVGEETELAMLTLLPSAPEDRPLYSYFISFKDIQQQQRWPLWYCIRSASPKLNPFDISTFLQ